MVKSTDYYNAPNQAHATGGHWFIPRVDARVGGR